MKISIILTLSLLSGFGQETELDSLVRLSNRAIDRKERVDLLNIISRKYAYINHDSSMIFAEKAYKEAVAGNYIEGEIKALFQKCFYYLRIGDNKAALDLVKQAEFLSEKSGDKQLLAESYMIRGDIFAKTMLIDQAFEYYTNAFDIYDFQKNCQNKFLCLNRIGVLHATLENYDEAMVLFQKARRGFDSLNLKSKAISTINNIALVYASKGDHEKALDYYKNTIEQMQSVRNNTLEATILGNMAIQYVGLGDTASALIYFDRSLELCRRIGDVLVENRNLLYKCDLLYELRKYDTLEDDLLKILSLSKKSGWSDLAMEAAHLLALVYKAQGKYVQAYDYFEEFYEYYKIVESEGNTKKFTELQFKYDFEKEALKIEARNRRKTLLMATALSISIMGIILITILFIHLRTRAAKTLLQQDNLILEKDKLKLEQQNLTKELELRNKEITSNIILLQKKNDMITTMADKLIRAKSYFTHGNRDFIEKCIEELRDSAEDSDWKNFEVQFNQVYESFYKRLDEINPNLTVNDRRLCAYLRLKMSTKEIAALTNSTHRSVEVARYRLRKKLNITDPSVSLSLYLEHL
nr:tetratricopeptide repeat protein [Bacteroidota bacterium]